MLAIACFNWPFYLIAALAMIAALAGFLAAGAISVKAGCTLIFAGAAYFFFGSLTVSHLIYDLSDLYRWDWLTKALEGSAAKRAVVCHAGFDEVSEALAARLPDGELRVLDHFAPETMTEPSVRRARRMYPPTPGTLSCPSHRWPVESGTQDVIFGLLAIHELRSVDERAAWFAEAKRCLKASGRVVIAEHIRDAANFIAFGPGFLHFHSRRAWMRSWEKADLRAVDEFRVTPWIRVFILTPSSP
ncbi:MAG: methyltransferase [Verrucomicrobiaceae bacterium]|nr:MAG: methyltransferase [Verrucomicrobiaceae bacterium]